MKINEYLKSYRIQLFFYILLSLVYLAGNILLAIFLADTVVYLADGEYAKTIYTFLIVIGLYIFIYFAYILDNRLYYKVSNKIVAMMSSDIAQQVFKLDTQTFRNHNTGTFVRRIIDEPNELVSNLNDFIMTIFDIIESFVIVIYIMTFNIWIALGVFCILIISSLIEHIRVKSYSKHTKEEKTLRDTANSITTEIIKSEEDIKTTELENTLYTEVKKQYIADTNKLSELYSQNSLLCNLRTCFIMIASILLLCLGVWFISTPSALKGTLTFASFMVIYSNRWYLNGITMDIGGIGEVFARVKISYNRIKSLFDEEEFITEKFGKQHYNNLESTIEFKNVSFKYEHEDEVINDLSFKINSNSTVAFIGKSGSGKSTIINLISKLFTANNGQILIGNKDINTLDKETLRNNITVINQSPYIFNMTIKENLLLANRSATEEELWEALRKASIEDFVNTLDDKLDTMVGENGINLSGGQKQRLAIARALLKDSKILIMDESTSSLDNFAQENIIKSISSIKNKTVIIIAHRLSTVKDVDKIFFIDNGQIKDEGTFDYLFTNNETVKEMFLSENII